MQKRYVYILTLALFLTATGFIVFKFNREEKKKQEEIALQKKLEANKQEKLQLEQSLQQNAINFQQITTDLEKAKLEKEGALLEIDTIKKFINEYDYVSVEKTQVNLNDRVRIINGPLMMWEGNVVEMASEPEDSSIVRGMKVRKGKVTRCTYVLEI